MNDRISEVKMLRTKFVKYTAAADALAMIEDIYTQPVTHRPRCCLLLGNGNNGKTSVLDEFRTRYPGSDCLAAEAVDHPVLYVMAPPQGQLRMLYKAILKNLGVRHANSMLTSDLYDLATRMIVACGVKMIIIDEFHNILVNGRVQKNTLNFLDEFRYMLNDWGVPVVCAGTPDQVENVIDMIDQISTRFNKRRITLPDWQASSMETKGLLKCLGDALPTSSKTNLNEGSIRRAIVNHGKGRLGNMVDVIIEAAIDAIQRDESITVDQLNRLNGSASLPKAA